MGEIKPHLFPMESNWVKLKDQVWLCKILSNFMQDIGILNFILSTPATSL